jgi:hypothetical protein
VIGEEPWEDDNGVVMLVSKELMCPKGLAVSPSFTGGVMNPCTVRTDTCGEYSGNMYNPLT